MPLAVIRTPYIERLGTRAGPLARWMLRGRRRKKLMRTLYALGSTYRLKHASLDETGRKDFWQAGRSVAGIHQVKPAGEIVREFAAAERGRAGADAAGDVGGLLLSAGRPLPLEHALPAENARPRVSIIIFDP